MSEMKNADLKGSNPTKIKLLKLLELLRRETDEEHPLTTAGLLTKLEAEGIPCDRRTLSKDISVLNSHGYEIMSVMIGHDKAYYVEDRSFSLPELKILIDAVQAAAFITDRKTDELIEKIAAMGGSHRSDLQFFFITKRPDRFYHGLPADWGDGYDNVTICCTCENQTMADQRLPIFLELPIRHKEIIHEPMLGSINIEPYLAQYAAHIEGVSCGGESGNDARILDFARVQETHNQCVKYRVPFSFHQTGYHFKMNGRLYTIPRKHQHTGKEGRT